MKTAVQVLPPTCDAHPRAELLSGTPSAVISTPRGPVALFGSGEIVAYLLRFRRRPRLFVFRTLTVDDRLAATLPGVRPRVQLLLELRSAGRIRRARGLFAYLARTERDPSSLADDFYLRIGLALGGRLPAHKILVSLLERSTSTAAGIILVEGASGANVAPNAGGANEGRIKDQAR